MHRSIHVKHTPRDGDKKARDEVHHALHSEAATAKATTAAAAPNIVIPMTLFSFPSPADNFMTNYAQLLDQSYSPLFREAPLGYAKVPGTKMKRVCIIGAGISGCLAAREMTRCGYYVDLVEASSRVGGRTYSIRAPATTTAGQPGQLTTYEQGAMRIPFFNVNEPSATSSSYGPWVGGPYDIGWCNSVANFWALKFQISTLSFPDPGKAPITTQDGRVSSNGVNTAVYVYNGRGVDLDALYGKGKYQPASAPFTYTWPADGSSANMNPIFPTGTDVSQVKFYNKGDLMADPPVVLQLGHAIPNAMTYFPKTLNTSNPNDVQTWQAGVLALRTLLYKYSLFATIITTAITGGSMTYYTNNGATQKQLVITNTPSFPLPYDSPSSWMDFWRNKIMPRYQNVSFYEVAMAGPMLPIRAGDGTLSVNPEWANGNFGGLGMSAAEASLFYTVGAGDGSWGAFYPQSSLWALRALLFGYAKEHQLILGMLNSQQTDVRTTLNPPADTTPAGQTPKTILDSQKKPFTCPQYVGVNSFTQGFIFQPLTVNGTYGGKSFYDLATAATPRQCNLYVNTKVTQVNRKVVNGVQTIDVSTVDATLPYSSNPTVTTREYDYVLCTVPIWNAQTDMQWTNWPQSLMPTELYTGIATSHWIRTAKVFICLKQSYWTDTSVSNPIPQVLSTNSVLQDVYGYGATSAGGASNGAGVMLLSYTWEDDAQKFEAYQEQELALMLTNRLRNVLSQSGYAPIDKYMLDPTLKAAGSYFVWIWEKQPFYHGCAKAYQPGIENLSMKLMLFNKCGAPATDGAGDAASGVFFSGDSYSLESGWLEPAMRSGIDATLWMLYKDPNTMVNSFNTGFQFPSGYQSASFMTWDQTQVTKQLGPAKTPSTESVTRAEGKRDRS